MHKLEALSLSYNSITLSEAFKGSPLLKNLNLSSNKINKSVFEFICSCVNLQFLSLYACPSDGVNDASQSLCLTNLVYLNLGKQK